MDDHAFYRDPAYTVPLPWEQPGADRARAEQVVRAQAWWNTRQYALLGIVSFNGYRRYKYLGVHLLAGNTTLCWIVRLAPGSPAIDAQWWVEPPVNHKWDAIYLLPGGPAGTDLEVWGTTHEIKSGERDNNVAWAALAGAVADPYPQGQAPIGGAFDTRALVQQGGGGGTGDPGEIAAAVLDTFKAELGGELGRLLSAIVYGQSKAAGRAAIMYEVEAGNVVNIATIRQAIDHWIYTSPGAYRRFADTMFEELTKMRVPLGMRKLLDGLTPAEAERALEPDRASDYVPQHPDAWRPVYRGVLRDEPVPVEECLRALPPDGAGER